VEKTLAEYLAHAPVFVRRLDGEIVYWTQGAQELYGFSPDEAVGRRSHELLKTKFPEPLEALNRNLLEVGEWRGRLGHTGKDGTELWTESLWRFREPQMVVEQNLDISPRIRLERQRDVLTQELDHRVKNTLAVVQGLARLTFNQADMADVRRFEERLLALSQAHNLLRQESWDHAQLKDVIRDVSRGLNVDAQIGVQGADVRLRPSAAVAYALAFHELCTNALKHGALRSSQGRVEITWSLEGEGEGEQRIHLIWRELAETTITPPVREGFGFRLIRRAVASELGTPVDLRFEEGGLVCEFGGPVQKHPQLP
jgi:two-component system CheB/CheR fusion protein